MSLKEQVLQELDRLPELELKQVADYLAFLKFRARRTSTTAPDEASLAALYAELAEEDRRLAEEGMDEYALALADEDAK